MGEGEKNNAARLNKMYTKLYVRGGVISYTSGFSRYKSHGRVIFIRPSGVFAKAEESEGKKNCKK